MIRLALFDVDGTLIQDSSFLGRFAYAIDKVFHVGIRPEVVIPTGITDAGVAMYMAAPSGISEAQFRERVGDIIDAQIEFVEAHRETEVVTIRPGVQQLLNELKSRGVKLGLVTGGCTHIARVKLEKAGIYGMFDLGAFGDRIATRNELIQEALKTYRERFGPIENSRIMYFGDTPYDVEGAHAAGLRIIAPSTRRYSVSDLAGLKADFPMQDLSDTQAVLKILDS